MGTETTIVPGGNVGLAELAAALIAVLEGCRLAAYQDTGGVWTIGFGHTGPVAGRPLDQHSVITHDQAVQLLHDDSSALFQQVAGRPLLEAAALVSFGYNCGPGALTRVLGGHATLSQFVHDARGNELDGLVRRRRLEETLILVSQQRENA